MRLSRNFLVGLIVILCSCGGSGKVMDTGVLQKRKFRPGWDLSFGSNDRSNDRRNDALQEHRSPAMTQDLALEVPIPGDRVTASKQKIGSKIEAIDDRSLALDQKIDVIRVKQTVIQPATEVLADPDQQESELPKKKWNKFAIPAFLAALATLYFGFFGTSTIAVIVALVVTFTLSGISLRQIRSRDEAGKGFALSALLIAVVAAVVTAIVTYAIGFV